ncbi:FlhC family transcriptional regulator [Escherichia coli]
MELITLGARLQMLESETQLSRGRLIKLYKELRGQPAAEGNAAIFHGLVYDMGTEYPLLHVLQCLAVLTQKRSMLWR